MLTHDQSLLPAGGVTSPEGLCSNLAEGFLVTKTRMSRAARRIAFLFALHTGVVAQAAPPQEPSPDPARLSVQSKPTTTDADFAEARRLIQQGKIDDAIAELEVLEARDPNAKGLHLELGTAYYKKSDYGKAVGFLKKAVASDPN